MRCNWVNWPLTVDLACDERPSSASRAAVPEGCHAVLCSIAIRVTFLSTHQKNPTFLVTTQLPTNARFSTAAFFFFFQKKKSQAELVI